MRLLAVLCLFALPLAADAGPAVSWNLPAKGEPGIIKLWVGNECAGALDPFAGTWTPTGGKPGSLREFVARNNPPADGTGAVKPAAEGPKRGGVCECDKCGPDCKCGCGGQAEGGRDNGPAVPRGGVDRLRFRLAGERYTIAGREADRAEALSAIAADGDRVPDDGRAVRLTVIGSAAAREAVLGDLRTAPALAYWRDKLVVQGYPADHWRIKAGGFATPRAAADAVIYVQRHDGTVLWRQDNYDGGAPALARALRDKVPGYDPSKDPSPQPPTPAPSPGPAPSGPSLRLPLNAWWLAVPGVLAALYLASRFQRG